MFWENLNEKAIITDLEAKSDKEVFQKLGGRLVDLGYCKDSYVEALTEREKTFPTGIQVEDIGVAIPHTDPEHINESVVAIATLKEPVTFFHMGTNPEEGTKVSVELVIMLGIAGREHLEMLQVAIQLIQDKTVVQKLLNAKTAQDIIQIVKEKENES